MEQTTQKKRKRKKLTPPVASAKPTGYLYFIALPKTTTNEKPVPVKNESY